jgi:hypothetical protein
VQRGRYGLIYYAVVYFMTYIYCAYCWFIVLLYSYVIGRAEENDENPEVKRSPSEDSNPGPPEYESGVLPTRPSSLLLLL